MSADVKGYEAVMRQWEAVEMPPDALRRAFARLNASLGFGIGFTTAQGRFRPLLRSRRSAPVDLVTELGDVAEDADLVVANLHETAVDGDVELAAIGQRDSGVVLGECTKKWGMTR